MTRLTLRKGFTLQPAPGGVGHLSDTRTGDALVVPPSDFQVLQAAGKEFDPSPPALAAVLVKYRPFYVEAIDEAAQGSFYELELEDAPTVPQIPSIAPVTMERPAVAPKAEPAPEPLLQELEPLPETETTEHPAFAQGAEEFTQPAGIPTQQPPQSEPVTREENLQAAVEPQHTEQVSPADVAAAINGAAAMGAPSAAPEVAAIPRSGKRPLVLALVGVTLLAAAVAVTFALRPKGETLPETPNPTTVADAGTPEPVVDAGAPESALDAGANVPIVPEPIVDAGAQVATPAVDAGGAVVEAGVDAGAPTAEAKVDAGAPETTETQWLTAEVQARGRVKMGEVTAGAEGEVSWTVTDEERVKAKQAVGSVARASGEPLPLTAPSVGLVMIKKPAGEKVKRGAVLAEIIYFEAWARGATKGAAPKMGWRCEVSSAVLQKSAECKISVVAPKGTGAVVTVAIEPRWFDGATDAVLRFAPP